MSKKASMNPAETEIYWSIQMEIFRINIIFHKFLRKI